MGHGLLAAICHQAGLGSFPIDHALRSAATQPGVVLRYASRCCRRFRPAGRSSAGAQPMLYAQRLPEGTVYIRLASALPDAATVATDFAGKVELGKRMPAGSRPTSSRAARAARPCDAGDRRAARPRPPRSSRNPARSSPWSCTRRATGVRPPSSPTSRSTTSSRRGSPSTTRPDDCAAGSLAEQGGRPVFASVPAGHASRRARLTRWRPPSTAACGSAQGGAARPRQVGRRRAV